ncbi:MAG: hypothetical protein K1000chlam2_00546 [Chlamydiae bacterium]|nr:hypothetical protein [Chlamydiota bacterium]
MRIMKTAKIFLTLALIACSCQKQEEQVVDLDQMVLLEEEAAEKVLAGEPLESPQEILLKEPTAFE